MEIGRNEIALALIFTKFHLNTASSIIAIAIA